MSSETGGLAAVFLEEGGECFGSFNKDLVNEESHFFTLRVIEEELLSDFGA